LSCHQGFFPCKKLLLEGLDEGRSSHRLSLDDVVIELLSQLLHGIAGEDVGDAFPLDSFEQERDPCSLHVQHVVVQGVLAEGELSLTLQELDVLLGTLQIGQALLRDVCLLGLT